jgi:hypothetical protein
MLSLLVRLILRIIIFKVIDGSLFYLYFTIFFHFLHPFYHSLTLLLILSSPKLAYLYIGTLYLITWKLIELYSCIRRVLYILYLTLGLKNPIDHATSSHCYGSTSSIYHISICCGSMNYGCYMVYATNLLSPYFHVFISIYMCHHYYKSMFMAL